MTITELFESESADADATGRAEITLQPLQAFHRWRVKRMTVSTTDTTLVPTVKVYRGGESPSNLVDGTFTGTLDHSDTDLVLRNGEPLVFVFFQADVGTTCSVTIEGQVEQE